MMKRFITLLSFLAMTSPAMAQSAQPDSDTNMRVQATLKAATTDDASSGIGLPEPNSSMEMNRPQANRAQENQPLASQPSESQPEMDEADSQAGLESIPPSCSNLRAVIERKLRANDVPRFTLEVFPTVEAESHVALAGDRQNGAEIVGSCDAGNYKVIYRRG